MKKNITKKLLDKIHGNVFISDKFHSATNNRKINGIQVDEVPQSWITINFKTYPRLPRVTFKEINLKGSFLGRTMNERRSVRQFRSGFISKKELYYLLFQSSGVIPLGKPVNESRRPYPSAGARYPLEIYPLVLKCDEIKKGLYHYNVKENALELLYDKNIPYWLTKIRSGQQWIEDAAVIFIITGALDRTRVKYGDRGYRYALLEAGHLGQNLCLLATELGLGTCALGGYIDAEVDKLLDVSLQKEVTLYLIAAGKV